MVILNLSVTSFKDRYEWTVFFNKFTWFIYIVSVIACYFHYVGDCTFEKSFCGWRNSKTDNYDWVLQSGNYSGTSPHPSGDHTFGARKGQCHYI